MTRFESFRQMQRVIRSASGLLLGAALLLASFTLGSTPAFAQFAGPVPLSLVNGWTNAPFGTSNAMPLHPHVAVGDAPQFAFHLREQPVQTLLVPGPPAEE
jgi:hypothetical protein